MFEHGDCGSGDRLARGTKGMEKVNQNKFKERQAGKRSENSQGRGALGSKMVTKKVSDG